MTAPAGSAAIPPIGVITTTLGRVSPNQPKTPHKCFRIPQDEYDAALATAVERGETLTSVVRAQLKKYVKANAKKAAGRELQEDQ